MIGLDTNVLVRFLTRDDAAMSPVAARILNGLTPEQPGFISLVALVETAWVLRRSYRLTFEEIGDALSRLAQSPAIRFESEPEALQAIMAAKMDGAELADVLLVVLGRKTGCSVTLTFDEDASRLPGFQLAT